MCLLKFPNLISYNIKDLIGSNMQKQNNRNCNYSNGCLYIIRWNISNEKAKKRFVHII